MIEPLRSAVFSMIRRVYYFFVLQFVKRHFKLARYVFVKLRYLTRIEIETRYQDKTADFRQTLAVCVAAKAMGVDLTAHKKFAADEAVSIVAETTSLLRREEAKGILVSFHCASAFVHGLYANTTSEQELATQNPGQRGIISNISNNSSLTRIFRDPDFSIRCYPMLRTVVGIFLMCSTAAYAASVASLKKGASIEISGFEVVDDSTHMIVWLGKGKEFRQFVVNDVETELYGQDKGAQLLSVHCKSKPNYETGARPNNDGTSKAIVTRFSVTSPLAVRVRASNGKVWRLDVSHNYAATNLDAPENRKLTLNFGIIGQNAE